MTKHKQLRERDFHAAVPGVKPPADITGFVLSNGRLYFSPVIDCHDGGILAYAMLIA